MESRQETPKKKHWNRPKQNLVVAGVFEVNYLQVIIFSYLLGFFFVIFCSGLGTHGVHHHLGYVLLFPSIFNANTSFPVILFEDV